MRRARCAASAPGDGGWCGPSGIGRLYRRWVALSNGFLAAAAKVRDNRRMSLGGRRILLAVGGGIAAYKACELLRLLVKAGAEVRVAMTPAAQRFVAPLTFQALSGRPVAADLFEAQQELTAGHVALAELFESIRTALGAAARDRDLAGLPVLITAGPTREHLDPVRFLSNPSSGRMGFALAAAARDRGAQVLLVAGPTEVEPPAGVELV